jgi:uncharacterized lipoprotein YehR (DUF1307 family)
MENYISQLEFKRIAIVEQLKREISELKIEFAKIEKKLDEANLRLNHTEALFNELQEITENIRLAQNKANKLRKQRRQAYFQYNDKIEAKKISGYLEDVLDELYELNQKKRHILAYKNNNYSLKIRKRGDDLQEVHYSPIRLSSTKNADEFHYE